MDRVRYRLNLARLTDILGASRVSQNHWSIKLGFSRGHWSDIVNGRHPYPSEKTRLRMIEVFGVSELFTAEQTERNADVDFRIAVSGRYELTGEIGQGGMGTVYTAHDLSLARLVAIKVVSPEAAAGIGPEQLLKEIAVVARLQHPNILPLFDAGTGAGSPYYVMPYVRAGSLGARLRAQGRLPINEVAALVSEIAAGLAHAHAHRVLHCDIKPENILVDGAHPYVMDFGIARKLHTEANEWIGIRKELDFSAGTPAYVSPEQAAGDRDIDERSDVYSLACVTYEMLTGRTAFAGNNTQEIVSLRFREPPPPLQDFAPEVPIAVARAIDRAMSLDPDRRPAGPAEFATELQHAATAASSMATRVSLATTRTQRWIRTHMNKPDRAIRTGALGRAVDGIKQDVVYAFRQRLRNPALTAVAVTTLAIAIGLGTTVFALVEGVLLRPLPFPNQERLVALESVDSLGQNIPVVSSSNWFDWRTNRSLAASAIYMSDRVSVVAKGNAMRAKSGWVSPDFFTVVGARFLFGRTFDSVEVAARSGGAVITEEFWRRELGAARDTALAIRVNGYRMPVVGVLARGQAFPPDAEVWTAYTHRQVGGMARNNINWHAIGRLKDGVTVDDAQRDLSAIAQRVDAEDPGTLYTKGVHVLPVRDQLAGDVTSLLWLLSGAVGVVLLIACANLASANLAQGSVRQREMALRTALGAQRHRLIRQVLIENVGIASVGAAVGVGFAWALLRAAVITQGAEFPHITTIGLNATVLAIAIVMAVVAGIATGILPALQASRAAPNDVLGGSARGTVRGSRGIAGRVLVVAEIAMALMLVAGAGLFVRSFRTVLSKPLGFDPVGVSYAEIALGGSKYQRDTTLIAQYWTRLAESIRESPGVRAASVANFVPLVRGGTGFIDVEGKTDAGIGAGYRVVGDGYFDAIGMTRYAGRDFTASDGSGTERVALVNKAMADRYWNGDPIGKRVRALSMEPTLNGQPSQWITVIGLVSNVRHFGYELEPGPEMFVLYRQLPAWRLTAMSVIARGNSSTAVLEETMRSAVRSADVTVPADISSLDAAAKRMTASRRFTMQVLGVFGGLSLLLAAIGVYGILSFSVAQRTREIAVRSALGADREKLLGLVFGSAGVLIVLGIALGLGGVYAGGKLVESMLFEVKASDPMVVGISVLVIGVAGALAAAIPARRAVRVDPMEVLRNDG